MINKDTSIQPGGEQSGNNRQQQAEQKYSGPQEATQGGSQNRVPIQNEPARNETAPSRATQQVLQRRSSPFYSSDPFAMFQQLSEQMDDMFDSFWSERPRRRRQSGIPTLWAPEVDVREEGNKLHVVIDLPGIPKDAVKVDIHDGTLTVQGERSEVQNEENKGYGFYRSERRYGSFYRSIPLPIPERKQARHLQIQG